MVTIDLEPNVLLMTLFLFPPSFLPRTEWRWADLVWRSKAWPWWILGCTSAWLRTNTAPSTPQRSSESKVDAWTVLSCWKFIALSHYCAVVLDWLPASHPFSSRSGLQVEPGEEADPGSPRGTGHDRVPSSGRPQAQPVLEQRDGAAHQQQQVEQS